jgi:hypothetical protein
VDGGGNVFEKTTKILPGRGIVPRGTLVVHMPFDELESTAREGESDRAVCRMHGGRGSGIRPIDLIRAVRPAYAVPHGVVSSRRFDSRFSIVSNEAEFDHLAWDWRIVPRGTILELGMNCGPGRSLFHVEHLCLKCVFIDLNCNYLGLNGYFGLFAIRRMRFVPAESG